MADFKGLSATDTGIDSNIIRRAVFSIVNGKARVPPCDQEQGGIIFFTSWEPSISADYLARNSVIHGYY